MDIASGSICGRKHPEKEDHFGVRPLADGCMLVVVDGISSLPFSGSFAKWIVDRLMRDELAHSSIEEYLNELYLAFRRDFDDFQEMYESGVSFAMVVVSGNQATAYWAGDSLVFHTQSNGTPQTTRVSTPHVGGPGVLTNCFHGSKPFRPEKNHFTLYSGDFIVVVSDGVIVECEDLTCGLIQTGNRQDFVNELLRISNELPHSDDATMICYRHL